jgi:acetyltransferase-like isoleucine patch superfamily enzyme
VVETDTIGANSRVWAFSHVMAGAHVGKNCNIGEHCFIESGASIGDHTVIKNGCMVWEGIKIEKEVFVGPNVFFTNDLYPRSRNIPSAKNHYKRKQNWLVPTVVKRGASLGAGAVILAGVIIGEYSMVAAGSVVTKDVPPYGLVKGNPGRLSGWVCQCGKPVVFDNQLATCSDCRLRFLKGENTQIVSLKER